MASPKKKQKTSHPGSSSSDTTGSASQTKVDAIFSKILGKNNFTEDVKKGLKDAGFWPGTRLSDETYKIFADPIHGSIQVHPLCIAVMDTPEFQRLRDLKQLGLCYLVYPGASHNRFEHSLGMSFLAGEFGRILKENQPELQINNKDILCLELAGLCHDLGHGPFSHVFDKKFVPYCKKIPLKRRRNWKHETASINIFNGIYEEKKATFENYTIYKEDVEFIRRLMVGLDKKDKDKDRKKKTGRGPEKDFLYEIVANKWTGFDVDKFDYIARDCHQLNIRNNFDHRRFMQFARVMNEHICIRDKEIMILHNLFTTRYFLHKHAYQHKVVCAADTMVTQALINVDDTFWTNNFGSIISEIIKPGKWKEYSRMTDSILRLIQNVEPGRLDQAKQIISRIFSRDFFKCALEHGPVKPKKLEKHDGETKEDFEKRILDAINTDSELTDKDFLIQDGETKEDIEKRIKDAIITKSELTDEDFFIQIVILDFGNKKEYPLENLQLYSKTMDEKVKPKNTQKEISLIMQLSTFEEWFLRIYVTKKDKQEQAKIELQTWIKQHSKRAPEQSE